MTIERILEGLSRPYQGLRGMIMSNRGLVCSAHPLASQTGARLLDGGGNFMDAAIAVSAVLNVVEPYNSHLGGDAFMLIHRKGDKGVTAINASGPVPAAASVDSFPSGIPERGIEAVSVPGQVGAWKLAFEEYCSLPWPKLLGPAIAYARDGFPCNTHLFASIQSAASELGCIPAWREIFLPSGRPPNPGSLFVQKDLARSLEMISKKGPNWFYEGWIADSISDFSREQGALLVKEDLEKYEAETLEPIRTSYRGFDVFEQPPVSQGHILLEELNIVEGYELSSFSTNDPESIHLLVEAVKLSFSDRYRHSGDPRFVNLPLDAITSKEHAEKRRKHIELERARPSYPPGSIDDGDTTYFAVADSEGNAVSFIQSLFHGFGSGVVVPGTGILLNNRMTGFSLDPSSPNVLKGGKRTMHTLNTYFIFNDDFPLFVGGTPGGDKQVQTNLQVITKLLDWGMTVQEAAEHPRWAALGGLDLTAESRFPSITIEKLKSYGHKVQVTGPWTAGGAVQLIMIHPESGTLIGGSDPRCDGCAIGL